MVVMFVVLGDFTWCGRLWNTWLYIFERGGWWGDVGVGIENAKMIESVNEVCNTNGVNLIQEWAVTRVNLIQRGL